MDTSTPRQTLGSMGYNTVARSDTQDKLTSDAIDVESRHEINSHEHEKNGLLLRFRQPLHHQPASIPGIHLRHVWSK